MEIKSLQNISFEAIADAFDKAFADYAIQITTEQLRTMLIRRGFVPELSFAAFEDDTIVSFTLNGIGDFNGKQTAYDTGTGTIKEFRGQGLVSKVFEYSIPYLKAKNIEKYLLEVLKNNEKAIHIYEKNGFQLVREFTYHVAKNEEVIILNSVHADQYTLKETDLKSCKLSNLTADFTPSWQNTFDSILRKPEDFKAFGAYQQGQMVAYCIIDINSGDIPQLVVDIEHRRKGIASTLLLHALEVNQHHSIKFVNMDSQCTSIQQFLKACNIPANGNQLEMIKAL